jgi:hypothetical protein
MNDPCSMQIVCRREDALLFEKLGFSFGSGLIFKEGDLRPDAKIRSESSAVLLGQGEVDYAARVLDDDSEFGDLPKGLIYYGAHGPGSQYGDGVFASLGETLDYARCLCGSNWPAVEFNLTTGRFERDGLRAAKKYVATLGLAKWALIQHLHQNSPELCGRKKPATEAKP